MTTVSATSSTTQAGTTQASTGSSGLSANFDTFLTLLTTQLKNQDPTNAMDTSQMTSQLVQFSSVEQQIDMNSNLKQLIALQQTSQLTAAAPLLGKTVEVESDQLSLQGGSATLRLPAAGASTKAQVAVLDANGKTIKAAEVTLGSAATNWTWDGRNTAGTQQADGAYGYSVTTTDGDGKAQALSATVLAKATATERQSTSSGGNVQLVLGGLTVGFDAVRSVAD